MKKMKCILSSNVAMDQLLAMLIPNLLQTTLLALLTSLTQNANAINPQLLALPMPIHEEKHQRRDILELDEPQLDLGRAGLGIIVFRLDSHLLHRRDILCLVEAKDLRTVHVQTQRFGSHGTLVVVVIVVVRRWR